MPHLSLLVTFTLYFAVLLLAGYLGYRATQNLSDYLLGGRHLGRFVTALAAGASDMSGWLLMGLPGAIYLSGLSQVWIVIGLVIGAWLNWRCVAGRLRLYTEQCGNALTLPDYLAQRFRSHRPHLRIVTGLIILIFFACYCASGMVAGARLFETVLGISYSTSLWICAFATMTYVLLGGFLAVSWTDTLQGILMMGALLITPLLAMVAVGGWHKSTVVLLQHYPTHLNMFHGLSGVTMVSLLAWGLGYFGQPHILVRFMAAQSVSVLPAARRISITWMVLCLIGAVAVGLLGAAYFSVSHNLSSDLVKVNPERVFILLSQALFNPWFGGIILAAVLSAIMSTLSCQLLVCASALTQDVYCVLFKQQTSQNALVWLSRAAVLAVTLIALYLAATTGSQILSMVGYAWAGFGAAFGPVVLFSLFWARMTEKGALAGMLSGALTVFLWRYYSLGELYEILPGFLVASFMVVFVSWLDKPPSSQVLESFQLLLKQPLGIHRSVSKKVLKSSVPTRSQKI